MFEKSKKQHRRSDRKVYLIIQKSRPDVRRGLEEAEGTKSRHRETPRRRFAELSPRASREEVLVPGVRPAPSDDEDEDKVNAVRRKS